MRRLENAGRKERVAVDEYTIEHIMPQNKTLSPDWQSALGPEWERVQKVWLHTLGNLTLTGYNSEYSDRPFYEKRDMEGGFKYSPLKLNEGLGKLERWNEAAIQACAERLAEQAVQVWAAPEISNDALAAYQTKTLPATTYTIHNHPHLVSGPMADVFNAFRREVLALDRVVTEEFLKHYVAYKAETNFVDVIPQVKQLRLSLNMRFYEVQDSKGLCQDVSHLGRWGNGDVEIALSDLDELPYVMGLVRQALEKQLGGGEPLELTPAN